MTRRKAAGITDGAARRASGWWAERVAAWALQLRGFHILNRRYATRVGESDLIARRGRLIVFVEVKARARLSDALEAVTPEQRRRITRAAELFLQRYPRWADFNLRFDVVAVLPWRLPVHLADAWTTNEAFGGPMAI